MHTPPGGGRGPCLLVARVAQEARALFLAALRRLRRGVLAPLVLRPERPARTLRAQSPAISLSRHLSTLQDLASCAPQGEALGGWYGGGVVVMGKTRPSLTAGDTRSSTPASPAPPRRPHCQHAGCPGTRQRRLGPRSGSRCAERSEAPHRVVHRGHEAGPRARVHIRPELDQGTASAHLQPRCAAQRPAGASRPARRSEGDPTRFADESSMA